MSSVMAPSRVDALLEKAGPSRDKMLQAVIWLADMADFAEMNAVWDAWIPDGHAPARLRRGQARPPGPGGRNHRDRSVLKCLCEKPIKKALPDDVSLASRSVIPKLQRGDKERVHRSAPGKLAISFLVRFI